MQTVDKILGRPHKAAQLRRGLRPATRARKAKPGLGVFVEQHAAQLHKQKPGLPALWKACVELSLYARRDGVPDEKEWIQRLNKFIPVYFNYFHTADYPFPYLHCSLIHTIPLVKYCAKHAFSLRLVSCEAAESFNRILKAIAR